MKKLNIFLASSNELKEEREQFEIQIYRKCKMWYSKNIFIHLDVWEDLTSRMSPMGNSQSEYNEVIKKSDVLVLLAHTKVGIYTAEEFEHAHGQFIDTKKPFIYTYFKRLSTSGGNLNDSSVQNFSDKLKNLNHFPSDYTDFNDLWNQFNKELDRLYDNNFVKKSQLGLNEINDDIQSIPNIRSNIVNHSQIGRQINQGDHSTYNETN